jgi:hypothetical protein
VSSYTQVFGGNTLYPSDPSYLELALTADVTLQWPMEASTGGNVVARIIDVTPTGAYDITMPPADETSPGQVVTFKNLGPSTINVLNNAGGNLLTITDGQTWTLYLTGNATEAGTWDSFQAGSVTSQAQAAALAGFGIVAQSGLLSQSAPVTLFNADYTSGVADRAKTFVWDDTGSGTITLTAAATLGANWFVSIRNNGGGNLTVDPSGADLINGEATLVLRPGDSAVVSTDGLNFYTVGFGQSAVFAFDYTSIDLTSAADPYVLAGAELNRIAYDFVGVLTNDVVVEVPATTQQYWVANNTTGGSYTVSVATSMQASPLVVPRGSRGIYYSNGADVIKADTASIATPIAISDGGTGAANASGARINLGGTAVGIGVFTAANAGAARASMSAAASGANADITSLTGLTTPLSVAQGGTASTTAADARTALAVPGTGVDNTFTGKNTFNGASTAPAMKLLNALEAVTITGTAVAAAATINFDLSTQSVLWYNVNATGNPTAVNFRLSSGTSLNTAMAVGESVTCAMLIKNGATAYFLNTSRLTVDTSGTVTVLWLGAQPTAGTINGTDIYTFVIMKTAATTWTIFASQASFV